MSKSIRIYVADDHEITRAGLRNIQALMPDIVLIGETGNAVIAVADIIRLQPDVAILDLRFGDDSEAGVIAIRETIQQCPQQKIIAISNWPHLLNLARLAGAVAVGKDISFTDLVALIRIVHCSDVPQLRIHSQPALDIEQKYAARLAAIPPGRDHADDFEECMAELLSYLFADQLCEARSQLRNIDNTQIRDLVFLNTGATAFWNMLLQRHDAGLIIFELKNVHEIKPEHFYQLTTYLTDTAGHFGCLVGRTPSTEQIKRRQRDAISGHGRVILYLSDQELAEMLAARTEGRPPDTLLARLYADLVGAS